VSHRLGQPVRFVLVGVGGFVLNVCAFTALFGLGAWYLAASVVAYLASNAAMYVGNRYFTFGLSHRGFVAAYLRYVVGAVVAALTALLLAALVERLEVDPRLGQALALTALVPVSFLLSKRFAFRLHPDTV
jgi:putative flippase GtrA